MGSDFGCRCDGDRHCADCTCAEFQDSEVPCCWRITIADMVGGGSCGAQCADLERIFYVRQTADGSCLWRCAEDFGCGIELISLVAAPAGGADHTLTVSLGGYTWEKTYVGTSPVCRDMVSVETSIPLQSAGTECNSNPTCTIRPETASGCLCRDCYPCQGGTVPYSWLLAASGVVNKAACLDFWDFVCVDFNGSFVLTPVIEPADPDDVCYWHYVIGTGAMCDPNHAGLLRWRLHLWTIVGPPRQRGVSLQAMVSSTVHMTYTGTIPEPADCLATGPITLTKSGPADAWCIWPETMTIAPIT